MSAFARARALLAAILLLATAVPLGAQQFGTDDAGVASVGACQVEAWQGAGETRIEPACRLIPALEVTLGMELDTGVRGGVEAYTLELKSPLRAPEPGAIGVALLVGADLAGARAEESGRLTEIFAMVPVTFTIGDDRLLLHTNLGWRWDRDTDPGEGASDHAATWGARGDLTLPWADERLVLVGELFGLNTARPEFQAGIRGRVVPDRLIVDLSYGGHSRDRSTSRGWIIGFGWTPPSAS